MFHQVNMHFWYFARAVGISNIQSFIWAKDYVLQVANSNSSKYLWQKIDLLPTLNFEISKKAKNLPTGAF